MNFLLCFSYNGSKYSGYQKQPGKRTIQSEIESILKQLYQEDITIYASGRTDAKVHAINQYANFKASERYSTDELKYKLNKMLPNDILIKSVKVVDEDFNARFNAKGKTYEYVFTHISNHDVFKVGLITEISDIVDKNKMLEIKDLFIGKHNFMNFTSKEEDQDNFIREIFNIEFVEHKDNSYSLIYTGSGFMMYQIRMITANIVLYSTGKIEKNDILNKLESKERNITNYCFPAEGLYLKDVKY